MYFFQCNIYAVICTSWWSFWFYVFLGRNKSNFFPIPLTYRENHSATFHSVMFFSLLEKLMPTLNNFLPSILKRPA